MEYIEGKCVLALSSGGAVMLCRIPARADTSANLDSANDSNDAIDATAFAHKDSIGRFLA